MITTQSPPLNWKVTDHPPHRLTIYSITKESRSRQAPRATTSSQAPCSVHRDPAHKSASLLSIPCWRHLHSRNKGDNCLWSLPAAQLGVRNGDRQFTGAPAPSLFVIGNQTDGWGRKEDGRQGSRFPSIPPSLPMPDPLALCLLYVSEFLPLHRSPSVFLSISLTFCLLSVFIPFLLSVSPSG